ncbi:MAG TPA: hypothetical protein VFK57_00220 [Vicinamibacterales bacterium]|nr:hypothetical protein [Vicinamibacterales bacterium]
MTSAFIAEAHRRRTRMTIRIWEHDCCGDMYWSAAARCDRCGEIATTLVRNLSIAEAMAGHPLLQLEVPQPQPANPVGPGQQSNKTYEPTTIPKATSVSSAPALLTPREVGSETGSTRRDSQDEDRAAVPILFWFGVGVSVMLGIYASEEATGGNDNAAIALAIAAAFTPLAVLCGLIDGRLVRRAGHLFRRS